MPDITHLISAVEQGDVAASEKLLPLVYDQLRQLARARLAAERAGHTLQPTALVHEAYLRLIGGDAKWSGRGHFFAAAAEAMRRILVDHARQHKSAKRGGKRKRIDMPEELSPDAVAGFDLDEVLSLDDALRKFEQLDPAKAELVKLLYFAGMNLDQAADAQGIGRSTAHRHWLFARAWLHRELTGDAADADY